MLVTAPRPARHLPTRPASQPASQVVMRRAGLGGRGSRIHGMYDTSGMMDPSRRLLYALVLQGCRGGPCILQQQGWLFPRRVRQRDTAHSKGPPDAVIGVRLNPVGAVCRHLPGGSRPSCYAPHRRTSQATSQARRLSSANCLLLAICARAPCTCTARPSAAAMDGWTRIAAPLPHAAFAAAAAVAWRTVVDAG